MKKLLIAFTVLVAMTCVAASHHSRTPYRTPVVHRGPLLRPAPMPHYHNHWHNISWWGKGGRNFWPGFASGLIGSLLAPAIVAPPLPPPAVLVNPVWVPPVYGIRPVYDVYGRIIRYEQYIVTPGYWR